MSELIVYKGVEIRQAEQIVLHDVNLHVESGEMIYMLGKVGSGKSSLMKTIYGALPITSGEAKVLDYDMTRIKRRHLPYLRRRIGIIFQDYRLLTDRSVEENLLFVLRATGWKDKDRTATCGHCARSPQVAGDYSCRRTDRKLGRGDRMRNHGSAL